MHQEKPQVVRMGGDTIWCVVSRKKYQRPLKNGMTKWVESQTLELRPTQDFNQA